MGFPGRMNEKKKSSVVFWVVTSGILGLILLIVFEVAKAVREPLKPEEHRQIQENSQPSVIKKKTDSFSDDINQIVKGDPLRRAPERKYGGSGVQYESKPTTGADASKDAASGYYAPAH